MVTDIAAKMQKVEKRRKETPRLKSCKQYQCDWCRRLLQNPSGLIRHKSYCVWNPILRTKTDPPTEQQAPKTNNCKEMQCEWCNRFFTSQHGVERHKTYCAWHPQRLKALKEQRKRRREEKAYYKAKQEKVSDKPEDEGCPNSPISVESDDTFHVTNNYVHETPKQPQPPTTPQTRPTVLRSSLKNCQCGCEFVELDMEYEEEIDVESLWSKQKLSTYLYNREKPRRWFFTFVSCSVHYITVYLCD